MKTIIKIKLLEGKFLELRSYELDKYPLKIIYCKEKNYKTHSHVGEDYMTLTLAQQKKGKVVNTQQSQFYPYSYYRMVKFLWKPSGKMDSMYLTNQNIVYKGNTAYIS